MHAVRPVKRANGMFEMCSVPDKRCRTSGFRVEVSKSRAIDNVGIGARGHVADAHLVEDCGEDAAHDLAGTSLGMSHALK